MTSVRDAPADTRMMGIVHDALRRDLGRAIDVLSAGPAPDVAQRVAIGDHVGWMMGFLDTHHHGEDAGLWPLVRERNPEATPLLDAMEADHVRVAQMVEACHGAAYEYRRAASDETRVVLLGALRRLCEVLLPHLEREERETMPLVSVTITAAELRAVEQQYFIKPKSLTELGFEGHWLLDGLDPERSQVVVHQVPLIPRLLLVHGFARRYRQRATACWGPSDPANVSRPTPYGPAAMSPRRIPRTGHVDTVVAAPIDALWKVVTDVTRVGEWSHECRRVEWLDGATNAVPGARFRGTNKAGPWTWSRINEVLVADEPSTFAWRTVPTLVFPDSSEWRI
jgi:hemerythrin-like domain-containing protein